MTKYNHLILLIISILSTQYVVNAAEMSTAVPLALEKPTYRSPWKRYDKWKQTNWKGYSNLSHEIPSSPPTFQVLTAPLQGDPAQGKALTLDDKRGGGCIACHVLPDAYLPGNVGPDLSMIGVLKRTDEDLFNRIYDARIVNPVTIMPPWGAHDILSRQEIADIVSYLQTLTQPFSFKTPQDNPAKRQIPTEEAHRHLEPLANPAIFNVELGSRLFNKLGRQGQSCQSCHQDVAILADWAVTMPKFEPRLNKIIGIEEFISRHALATTGDSYLSQSQENLSLAIYLRHLANGKPLAIDTSDTNTKAAVNRGAALMKRKIGQMNLSCMDCHVMGANKWIRGQYLIPILGMYTHFPTYRTSQGQIWDIRKRFQRCNVAIRANELPPDAPEYGDLEVYIATLNQGQVFAIPGIRH